MLKHPHKLEIHSLLSPRALRKKIQNHTCVTLKAGLVIAKKISVDTYLTVAQVASPCAWSSFNTNTK